MDLHRRQLLPVWSVLFVIVLLSGVLLRLVNLDGKVFWIDEAFTSLRISGYSEQDLVAYWSNNPIIQAVTLQQFQFPSPDRSIFNTIVDLANLEPHLPPLYFVLLRVWVQLFGSSISVIRSFSAFTSILSLPMIALLSKALFSNKKMPYIVVSLMALSPFQVIYAQEARPYSLWTLLIILTSLFFLRALRLSTFKSWLIYSLFLILSFYTFIYSFFVFIAFFLYVSLREKDSIQNFLIYSSFSLLGFLPWLYLLIFNRQNISDLVSWQSRAADQSLSTLINNFLMHIYRIFFDFSETTSQVVIVTLVPLCFFVMLFSFYCLWRQSQFNQFTFLFLLFTIPIIGVVTYDWLYSTQQSSVSRYFVPSWISLLIVVGYAGSAYWYKNIVKYLLITSMTLGLVSCFTSNQATSWWNKTGAYIPYVSQQINLSKKPFIIAGNDLWLLSLSHYLRPDISLTIVDENSEGLSIPQGYSDYFMYSVPDFVINKLSNIGIHVVAFDQLDRVPIWCIFPPNASPKQCPSYINERVK